MHPLDILPIVIIVVGVACILWLLANSRRHVSSTADFLATWLAAATLVFIVGGGLAMFGVAVLTIMLGDDAGKVGLVALVVGLALEPFVVLAILYRRRLHELRG